MWSGFDGSTTMFGSLFGSGSSQSSFVFAPPEVAVHSVAKLCLEPGATVRKNGVFSPPSPAWARLLAAKNSANSAAAASRSVNRVFVMNPPLRGSPVLSRNLHRRPRRSPPAVWMARTRVDRRFRGALRRDRPRLRALPQARRAAAGAAAEARGALAPERPRVGSRARAACGLRAVDAPREFAGDDLDRRPGARCDDGRRLPGAAAVQQGVRCRLCGDGAIRLAARRDRIRGV